MLLTFVFLLLGVSIGSPYAEADSSPLFLRGQSMAQFFRSSPQPQSAKPLATDTFKLSASKTWSNYWGYDKRYILDGQTSDQIFSIFYQVRPWLGVTVETGEREFSFSQTDDLAIGFHDLFKIPQDYRQDRDRDRTRFAIPDYGLDITEEQVGLSISQTIGGKFSYFWDFSEGGGSFSCGGYHELSPDTLYHRGATDILIQLSGYYKLGVGEVYGNANTMFFKFYKDSSLYMRDQQWSVLWGYRLLMADGVDLLMESLLTQSPFENLGQLSRTSYELHFGYRKSWQYLTVELTFIENVIWPYNAPDWGFTLGMVYWEPKG